ncbi:MAG: hypothetical protein OEL77_02950 [Nitrosopumilus sp.]|nr:hypothetical protein [Nitrosopumilus sp.]MDH3384953.1 hypothetical protein [Nitrosopumilus sp.]
MKQIDIVTYKKGGKAIRPTNSFFIKDKRICVMIDDDIDKKLRFLQAELIRTNQGSVSYSGVINYVLRKHFMEK